MNDSRKEALNEILRQHSHVHVVENSHSRDFSVGCSMCEGVEAKILAWADKWAGKPSRERIEEVLILHGKWEYQTGSAWRSAVITDILKLWGTVQVTRPRVTREQIRSTVYETTMGIFGIGTKELLVVRLFALLGIEQEKRWCPHFIWEDDSNHLRGWYYSQFPGGMIEKEWDICPVKECHAPRPKD